MWAWMMSKARCIVDSEFSGMCVRNEGGHLRVRPPLKEGVEVDISSARGEPSRGATSLPARLRLTSCCLLVVVLPEATIDSGVVHPTKLGFGIGAGVDVRVLFSAAVAGEVASSEALALCSSGVISPGSA